MPRPSPRKGDSYIASPGFGGCGRWAALLSYGPDNGSADSIPRSRLQIDAFAFAHIVGWAGKRMPVSSHLFEIFS
jgi:hypothetical protein